MAHILQYLHAVSQAHWEHTFGNLRKLLKDLEIDAGLAPQGYEQWPHMHGISDNLHLQ